MNYEFKSRFAGRINDMLKYRVALGRSSDPYDKCLANFDRFCLLNCPSESSLTKELALSWCNDASGQSTHRAKAIRAFARHLTSIGENAFLVPPSFFPARKSELPYIFTESEITNFFAALDNFPASCRNPILEYTIPVIFRLQYACGMRPQEVRSLRRKDFNFLEGTIYIADSKHYKDRRLAVTPDVMEMCRKYDMIANVALPSRMYFFQSRTGCEYKTGWFIENFHRCWKLSGNGNAHRIPTPYDLRHNFATRTLMHWVEEGKDLNIWLPYLTAYMGHAEFSATFHYIHLLPKRLSKMDFTRADGIIPEVFHE